MSPNKCGKSDQTLSLRGARVVWARDYTQLGWFVCEVFKLSPKSEVTTE